MRCCTAGCAVAAFGNCEVGLKTVVTLELDITAAAAAPEKKKKKLSVQTRYLIKPIVAKGKA